MSLRHAISLCLGLVGFIASFPASAAWESKTLGGADSRIYKPGSLANIGDGRALLVVLHGCSQTADQLVEFGNFELAAEEFGMVVVIPNVPGGGVVAGCWDYYGPTHTRAIRDNAAIIALAESLRDDPAYLIDPAQMYLTGFSSGAGQALVMGCLAPDLFAGVGVTAGPSVGTTVNEIQTVGSTAAEAAAVCEQLGGAHAVDFDTQLAVMMTDSGDFVVAQEYAQINAQMYGLLMGDGLDAMQATPVDVASLEGALSAGMGTVYSDSLAERIMWLRTDGVGHNWPAGSGAPGGGGLVFVSSTGVNLSYVLAEFFTANSLRAGGDWEPSDDTGDAGSSGGSTGSDSSGDESGGTDGSSGMAPDEGTGGGSGTGAAGGDPEAVEPSGCQCASTGRRAQFLGSLLLVGIAGARRRSRAKA